MINISLKIFLKGIKIMKKKISEKAMKSRLDNYRIFRLYGVIANLRNLEKEVGIHRAEVSLSLARDFVQNALDYIEANKELKDDNDKE